MPAPAKAGGLSANGRQRPGGRVRGQPTARRIIGAALIIIAVSRGFAMGDLIMFQQMGFGVAAALLIDATIVRAVLVPAGMKLLGSGTGICRVGCRGCLMRMSRAAPGAHRA
jgi:MMPL family